MKDLKIILENKYSDQLKDDQKIHKRTINKIAKEINLSYKKVNYKVLPKN